MEFDALIERRRSVRSYSGAAPKEALEQILSKAAQAPSWKNKEAWHSYAVTSPEALAAAAAALPDFNQKSANGAALIVTAFVRGRSGFSRGVPDNECGDLWGAYDLGLHDAYLVLAAADMGYDTLIMGIRDADALRKALCIPEGEQIMSVIAVGRRAADPVIRPRAALEEKATFF